MLVINRLCSSIIGILMLSQFFDPRGKRKKTNQIIFGTLVVEAIVIMNAGFRDGSALFDLVEVVVVASLFFAFYPLFYASVKKWVLVYLALINICIVTTVIALGVSNVITSNVREQEIAFGMIRLAFFAVWLIAIVIYGRDVFERICQWKNSRMFAIVKIVLSCFIIPAYLNYVYNKLEVNQNNLKGFLYGACSTTAFVLFCYFLYFILKEYFVKLEVAEHDNNVNVLRMATLGLEQRIEVMDEYAKKLRVINHDRRHFNAILLEMLNQGEIEEAKKMLETETYRVPRPIRKWCENETVNVAIGHYLSVAEEKGISLISKIDIPKEIEYDSIGLSMMLGNLIENAIQACQQIENGEKIIVIKVLHQGQFIIELENSCVKKVELDKNGFPTTKKMNHGYGTKSVVAFVKENQGEIVYSVKENRFSVRIILP